MVLEPQSIEADPPTLRKPASNASALAEHASISKEHIVSIKDYRIWIYMTNVGTAQILTHFLILFFKFFTITITNVRKYYFLSTLKLSRLCMAGETGHTVNKVMQELKKTKKCHRWAIMIVMN